MGRPCAIPGLAGSALRGSPPPAGEEHHACQEEAMAEPRKGGFHALEERIHQMEEEDAKREQQASAERQRTGKERTDGGAPAPAERK